MRYMRLGCPSYNPIKKIVSKKAKSGVIFLGDAFSEIFRYIDKLKVDFYNI